jgi:hypothetical protein
MVIVFPAVAKRVIDEALYQHHAERLTPRGAGFPPSARTQFGPNHS